MGTGHPFTTSYYEPTHDTQAGGHSGPDDRSSLRGTDEYPFEHPASVTDAITRLQRERDLALRRVDELHDYYKEIQKKDDAYRKMTLMGIEHHTN